MKIRLGVMKPKVYIETSVISYLTSPLSSDLVTAARQKITQDWWEKREDFHLHISEFVLREAKRGNASLAALRIAALQGLPEIVLTEETVELAQEFRDRIPLPKRADIDAFHMATAVVGGMDYLLTWNFKHLANAAIRKTINRISQIRGYEPCTICTPEELRGEDPGNG